MDKVRPFERKMLMAKGYEALKGSRYDWLYNQKTMDRERENRFKILRDSSLKAVRAWRLSTGAGKGCC